MWHLERRMLKQQMRRKLTRLFCVADGGFAIYRFNDAAETGDWHKTAKGRTCIHYNVATPEVAKAPAVKVLTCKQLANENFRLRYLIDDLWVADHAGFFSGGATVIL